MRRYVIVFADGGLSYARPWESMLEVVERTWRLPPTFRPRLVVEATPELVEVVGEGA